jgi:lipopolysaccharide transport system ATP-binding protein
MHDDVAIKVEHVSKRYCKSLKKSMLYGMYDITRNMIGLSSHSDRLRASEFWALDDISFEVKKGETLGVIGPNGAGKTTLLKLLNGIFWPDKGKITIKGKVGALIEVGAGFHPLLSGRENIYINGAILGMSKKEIDKKFDSIVDFAGIGDFLDVPVKNYSSGMYVRLGFAVAVHCDPDILLVDEVLSVGDGAFRNKCQQKMNEIKKNDVAIVFVSHDLFTVEKFCDRGIFLDHGHSKSMGEIREVIQTYQGEINNLLSLNQISNDAIPETPYCTKEIEIKGVVLLDQDGIEQKTFAFGDTLRVKIEYKAKNAVYNPRISISLWSWDGRLISVFAPHLDSYEITKIDKGEGMVECWIDKLPLLMNSYYINIKITSKDSKVTFDWWTGNIKPMLSFNILPNHISAIMGQYTGICHFDSKWVIENVKEKYNESS